MIIANILLALAVAGNAPPSPAMAERARANYEAVANGRMQLNQLTPQELVAVLALARTLRDDRSDQSPSERCFAEQLERAGGSPSHLEREVIDLKCRPLGADLE